MSNQQQEIELEMRLSAIEYMVCKLYATFIAASDPSEEKLTKAFQELREGARQEVFPDFDPAQSDLVSSEWELAVVRLLDMQKEMLEAVRAKREGK